RLWSAMRMPTWRRSAAGNPSFRQMPTTSSNGQLMEASLFEPPFLILPGASPTTDGPAKAGRRFSMFDLHDMTFCGADDRFTVVMTQAAIRTMVTACTEAGRKETGGILIGRIESDGHTATVLEATPKPRDSAF